WPAGRAGGQRRWPAGSADGRQGTQVAGGTRRCRQDAQVAGRTRRWPAGRQMAAGHAGGRQEVQMAGAWAEGTQDAERKAARLAGRDAQVAGRSADGRQGTQVRAAGTRRPADAASRQEAHVAAAEAGRKRSKQKIQYESELGTLANPKSRETDAAFQDLEQPAGPAQTEQRDELVTELSDETIKTLPRPHLGDFLSVLWRHQLRPSPSLAFRICLRVRLVDHFRRCRGPNWCFQGGRSSELPEVVESPYEFGSKSASEGLLLPWTFGSSCGSSPDSTAKSLMVFNGSVDSRGQNHPSVQPWRILTGSFRDIDESIVALDTATLLRAGRSRLLGLLLVLKAGFGRLLLALLHLLHPCRSSSSLPVSPVDVSVAKAFSPALGLALDWVEDAFWAASSCLTVRMASVRLAGCCRYSLSRTVSVTRTPFRNLSFASSVLVSASAYSLKLCSHRLKFIVGMYLGGFESRGAARSALALRRAASASISVVTLCLYFYEYDEQAWRRSAIIIRSLWCCDTQSSRCGSSAAAGGEGAYQAPYKRKNEPFNFGPEFSAEIPSIVKSSEDEGFRIRASTITERPGDHVTANKLPTVFKWEGGTAKEVYLSGSFNNWQTKIPLVKSQDHFYTIVDLPEGEHQYQFIVDGKWQVNAK
uniref:5'-AMP-activated protein kinase subunit beta-1 n=1 Tax=Macrostomum lignano TaxID=282301 RepID=A0A1I8GE90_9PLAT